MSVEVFKEKVAKIEAKSNYKKPLGFGICYADIGVMNNKVLQATYPVLNWDENFGSYAIFWDLRDKCEILEDSESEFVLALQRNLLFKL